MKWEVYILIQKLDTATDLLQENNRPFYLDDIRNTTAQNYQRDGSKFEENVGDGYLKKMADRSRSGENYLGSQNYPIYVNPN
ncbi:MAG: hypothetical protein C0432_04290 [Candidatus Puniceispirillum sp.]|nr:hypothetical protein [Candidatus Pelagibacter sp.]MBA4283495.1 hypothetical protein [Candidatus Puniceispirillum sp.]